MGKIQDAKSYPNHPSEWGFPWFQIKAAKVHDKYQHKDTVYDIAIASIESKNGKSLQDFPMVTLEPEDIKISAIASESI